MKDILAGYYYNACNVSHNTLMITLVMKTCKTNGKIIIIWKSSIFAAEEILCMGLVSENGNENIS